MALSEAGVWTRWALVVLPSSSSLWLHDSTCFACLSSLPALLPTLLLWMEEACLLFLFRILIHRKWELEGTTEGQIVHTPCSKEDHPQVNHPNQGFVASDLRNLQGGRFSVLVLWKQQKDCTVMNKLRFWTGMLLNSHKLLMVPLVCGRVPWVWKGGEPLGNLGCLINGVRLDKRCSPGICSNFVRFSKRMQA